MPSPLAVSVNSIAPIVLITEKNIQGASSSARRNTLATGKTSRNILIGLKTDLQLVLCNGSFNSGSSKLKLASYSDFVARGEYSKLSDAELIDKEGVSGPGRRHRQPAIHLRLVPEHIRSRFQL
ncbi:Putative acyl-CoA synthetase YngI [Tolypocladium paradoxum]|uniref:Acyl-CoA synthetase YngI n=1 Tax=Tolypocladium paradoxum TaxID=94208 RepID=A0A2S4L8R4_9HYPO|nr:Putative acyl-CoA synthetase YngI [Tolypocladium paradoxum]